MPRRARLALPNVPLHIINRGLSPIVPWSMGIMGYVFEKLGLANYAFAVCLHKKRKYRIKPVTLHLYGFEVGFVVTAFASVIFWLVARLGYRLPGVALAAILIFIWLITMPNKAYLKRLKVVGVFEQYNELDYRQRLLWGITGFLVLAGSFVLIWVFVIFFLEGYLVAPAKFTRRRH